MVKYLFNGEEFETREEAYDYIIEEYAPETYDEYLDEMYTEVTILSYNYSMSNALKKIDPVVYRCGMLDYANELFEEIEEEEIEEDEED